MKSPQNLIRILLPLVVLAAGIAIWELVVRINDIQPYVLPGFVAAAIGGVALALLFNQS